MLWPDIICLLFGKMVLFLKAFLWKLFFSIELHVESVLESYALANIFSNFTVGNESINLVLAESISGCLLIDVIEVTSYVHIVALDSVQEPI